MSVTPQWRVSQQHTGEYAPMESLTPMASTPCTTTPWEPPIGPNIVRLDARSCPCWNNEAAVGMLAGAVGSSVAPVKTVA